MSFGRITKLNVHIAKCQTHITYANDATRLLTNNPSGFAFRSMGATSDRCVGDPLTQARSFLRRHFGKRGSIERTPSLDNFLLAVGVDMDMEEEPQQLLTQLTQEETEAVTQEDAQEESQEDIQEEELILEPVLHTWHLEELPKVLPQLVTTIEYHTEHLELTDCAWHLQNCTWRHVPNSEFQLPNCQCQRIKETMGHINQLVKTSMPEEDEEAEEDKEQGQSKPHTRLMLDVNANIMSLNGLLQQLNELLEQQHEEQASPSSSLSSI
ncbi:hypothetical protein ACLKA7_013012 [Drosophila subpalustris]